MVDVILSPENPNINIKANQNGMKLYKYNNDDNMVTVSACPDGIPIQLSG
jgi:predicted lipoprotein with Yx(FWY)xxD motif